MRMLLEATQVDFTLRQFVSRYRASGVTQHPPVSGEHVNTGPMRSRVGVQKRAVYANVEDHDLHAFKYSKLFIDYFPGWTSDYKKMWTSIVTVTETPGTPQVFHSYYKQIPEQAYVYVISSIKEQDQQFMELLASTIEDANLQMLGKEAPAKHLGYSDDEETVYSRKRPGLANRKADILPPTAAFIKKLQQLVVSGKFDDFPAPDAASWAKSQKAFTGLFQALYAAFGVQLDEGEVITLITDAFFRDVEELMQENAEELTWFIVIDHMSYKLPEQDVAAAKNAIAAGEDVGWGTADSSIPAWWLTEEQFLTNMSSTPTLDAFMQACEQNHTEEFAWENA